jgi:Cro/C1-type HTH DNA-binding domain
MNTPSKPAHARATSRGCGPRPPRVDSGANAKPAKSTKSQKSTKSASGTRPLKPGRRPSSPAAKVVRAPVRLMLRARAVMADRGFRSISALQRSLAGIGVVISLPQLIRVVDGDARHLNKEVVEGMLTLFQCGVGDLLVMA